MAHVDEGMLQAYLDNEVAARDEVDGHLAACAECAERLDALRAASQLFSAAMHGSDVRAPTFAALAAVKRTTHIPVVPAERQKRRTFVRMPLARAAILVIGFAAIASAAIPGSPVRALISGALRLVSGADRPAEAPVVTQRPAPAFESRSELSATLSIQPVDGRVRVQLTSVASDAVIRVRLVDSPRAVIQATGAAARARFRTGPGRIEVVSVPGGEVMVEIPRGLRDARVEVDGRLLFQKEGGQLHLSEPAATGANSEFIFKP